jgi:hypothetical protein
MFLEFEELLKGAETLGCFAVCGLLSGSAGAPVIRHPQPVQN